MTGKSWAAVSIIASPADMAKSQPGDAQGKPANRVGASTRETPRGQSPGRRHSQRHPSHPWDALAAWPRGAPEAATSPGRVSPRPRAAVRTQPGERTTRGWQPAGRESPVSAPCVSDSAAATPGDPRGVTAGRPAQNVC